MIINQFDTNNETNEKKEKMTIKPDKKTTTETINITSSTSNILVGYLTIYSSLNTEGKIKALKEIRSIGSNYDLMQNIVKFKTYLKAKNKGVK
tara:strand:+ start:161 stop:439 length:279 start_codon:yes stop_codon:yes gene_type:complete